MTSTCPRCALLLILLGVLFVSSVLAEDPDATNLIVKMDQLLRGDSSKGTYRMDIITPDWSRYIEMKYWTLGKDKSMILITSPVKEKGISFLRVKTEVWNYLPSIERTIKIPPSMMMQSWMGSDFTNDDLVKESSIVNDYSHKLLREETIKKVSCYVCELIPNQDAAVVWGKILVWIRTNDNIPVREEFYDEDGSLVNIMLFEEIKHMGGRNIPTLLTMIPQKKTGHKTTMKISEAEFDLSLKESFFSLKNIKRLK